MMAFATLKKTNQVDNAIHLRRQKEITGTKFPEAMVYGTLLPTIEWNPSWTLKSDVKTGGYISAVLALIR